MAASGRDQGSVATGRVCGQLESLQLLQEQNPSLESVLPNPEIPLPPQPYVYVRASQSLTSEVTDASTSDQARSKINFPKINSTDGWVPVDPVCLYEMRLHASMAAKALFGEHKLHNKGGGHQGATILQCVEGGKGKKDSCTFQLRYRKVTLPALGWQVFRHTKFCTHINH